MLDDIKLIHTRDSKDALGIAQKQWEQYKHSFNIKLKAGSSINKIVFSGMGGSGLAAKVFKSWPKVNLPFEIVQDYDLPKYFDNNTLLIISSYSGNTEEELSVLKEAFSEEYTHQQNPAIVVISSGGALKEFAQERNLPFIELPGGFQPRYTLGYQLRALCELFDSLDITKNTVKELEESADWLKGKLEEWQPINSTKDNYAKQIAQEVIGKSVVIYASSQFAPVAYKWKISFNENAKSIAWWNQYPEFNHNEFLGWTNQPVEKPYSVIDLRSNLDNPQIQKRFIISEQLLSGNRPAPEVIDLVGESLIKQIMWAVGLGDFVSLYVAILSGIDPTPVDLIESFKLKLK